MLHRETVIEIEQLNGEKIKQLGMPIKFSGTPGKVRSLASPLGQRTSDILLELGYSLEAIDAFRQEGICT